MMPGKSSSRVAATKSYSSTVTAAFSSSNSDQNHSTIIKSAFAPTDLQLSLFASTIRSLDSEQLRIHDTITGELKSVHIVPGTTINCIKWGSCRDHASNQSSKKKKRKLDNGESTASASGSTVIVIGTGKPEIQLFSPLEGRVIATLEDAHERGTRDFVFSGSQEAWSLGTDGGLVQWNMDTLEKLQ